MVSIFRLFIIYLHNFSETVVVFEGIPAMLSFFEEDDAFRGAGRLRIKEILAADHMVADIR